MTDYTDLIERQRNFIGGELGNATADALVALDELRSRKNRVIEGWVKEEAEWLKERDALQARVKQLEDALRMVVEEYADGGDWQSVDRAARAALAEGDK